MKTIILSFLSVLFSTELYAQFGVIAQPEYSIMYRGYDNFIVPMISSNEIASVNVSGGTCQQTTRTVNGIQHNGYIVRPSTGVSFVTLTLSGKSKNGTIKNYGTFQYNVKMFPTPRLENNTISKATGANITVGLGADCPLGFSYEVIGGRIFIGDEWFNFNGNIVPPSILEKAEIGKSIAIRIDTKKVGSEYTNEIIGSIVVVE
jgi:hypothetical protein